LLLNLKACSAGEIVRSSGGIVRSREPAQTHASERHRPTETPDALDRIASFEPHPQREIAAVDRSPGQGTGGRSVFRIDEVAREVEEQVWLVSFLDHDLGFLDTEKGRVEPGPNPFVPDRVLTMCPEWTFDLGARPERFELPTTWFEASKINVSV
jgi:hypothetical protein